MWSVVMATNYRRVACSWLEGDDEFTWRRGGGVVPALRFWNGEFWWWTPTEGYTMLEQQHVRRSASVWLDDAGYDVSNRQVTELVSAARDLRVVGSDVELPSWLGAAGKGPEDPYDWVALRNGILSLSTLMRTGGCVLRDNTPEWFSPSILQYRYEPSALCPEWEQFLDSTFQGDAQRIDLLQECFGYLLSGAQVLDAIVMLVGPPRSGKSTICRVLARLVGHSNTVNPTLTSLGGGFGLWPLIGKSVAICPDAHLGMPERATRIMESLKSISGGDEQLIQRKYLPPAMVKLRTRFLLATNEMPAFQEASTAFSSRVALIPLTKSFVGVEDRKLNGRLACEREGIFNWAIRGLERLIVQGHLTETDTGSQYLAQYSRATSPMAGFFEDCCVVSPGLMVTKRALWDTWCVWCKRYGVEQGGHPAFSMRLHERVAGLRHFRPRALTQKMQDPNPAGSTERGARPWVWSGVQLRVPSSLDLA